MAGVPPIPPLVCSTPPPIDFGDDEDDSGLPPTLTIDDEDDFGEFALAMETHEDSANLDVSSLPRTPVQFELSSSATSGFTDVPPVPDEYIRTSPAPPSEIPIKETKNINNNTVTQALPNEAFNYTLASNLQKNVFNAIASETINTNSETISETSATNKIIASSSSATGDNNSTNDLTKNVDTNNLKEEVAESIISTAAAVPAANEIQCVAEVPGIKEIQCAADNCILETPSECNSVARETNSNDTSTQKQISSVNVILEDLTDDSSDDECYRSPKKLSAQPTVVNEDSDDFFAIHIVGNTKSVAPLVAGKTTETADFEDNSSDSHENYPVDLRIRSQKQSSGGAPADLETTLTRNEGFLLEEPKRNNPLLKSDALTDDKARSRYVDTVAFSEDANFNGDFGQFADFKSNLPVQETDTTITLFADGAETVHNNENAKVESNNKFSFDDDNRQDDDDFDDFQDFTSATVNTMPAVTTTSTASPIAEIQVKETLSHKQANNEATLVQTLENNIPDDDDDFGDFEEATFAAPVAAAATQSLAEVQFSSPPLTPITNENTNLQERLSSLLTMMFPMSDKSDSLDVGDDISQTKITPTSAVALPLESVESAKALEFQWPQSEIRHALIRAIGIDSRNILFGDNWNPAMPRFAANLSFNPLKPMKPQPMNTSAASTMPSGLNAEAATYSNASNMESMAYVTKSDVPEVEFDWQSAGLVNPLEGLKGEANPRETETFHTPPPGQPDASDDKHQSCSTYANIGENFPETLSKSSDLNVSALPSPACENIKDHHFITNASSMPLDNAFTQMPEQDWKVSESTAKRPLTPLHFNTVIEDLDDETVVTSTYAGPLKETHIYTPSKSELAAVKAKTNSISEPIDFDYEIAAAGIIIDETVVKKEYRDVEYNPGFSLEPNLVYAETLTVSGMVNPSVVPAAFPCDKNEPIEVPTPISSASPTSAASPTANFDCDDFTEFTEFQSVPPPVSASKALNSSNVLSTVHLKESMPTMNATGTVASPVPLALTKTREQSCNSSRTNSPSIIDNMILSPAILLPQAIPISTNSTTNPTPKIEWGNTTATINPEELARIEELFPQPKVSIPNGAQKASPTHALSGDNSKPELNALSISATIAQKEQDSALNDDYWSDFVSVPVPRTDANTLKNNNNNNHLLHSPKRAVNNLNANVNINANMHSETFGSPLHNNKHFNATRPTHPAQLRVTNSATESSANNCNDDDWSDFVSGTPATAAAPAPMHGYMINNRTPQFNSAAWQNANFYNNPIGLYHQAQQQQIHTRTAQTAPQQVHIMQDFSTMPTSRPNAANAVLHNTRNNIGTHPNHALQVGNARIAPSISLIPDLGFVAPAMPVHTAFINVLPKSNYNNKK